MRNAETLKIALRECSSTGVMLRKRVCAMQHREHSHHYPAAQTSRFECQGEQDVRDLHTDAAER